MVAEVTSIQRPEPFVKIAKNVVFDHDLTPGEFKLYAAIVAHINQGSGLAWPSYNRLMAVTGLCRDTVSKGLKRLEAKGLLVIIRRFLEGTKARAVNQYRLSDVVHSPDQGSLVVQPAVVCRPDRNKNSSNKTKTAPLATRFEAASQSIPKTKVSDESQGAAHSAAAGPLSGPVPSVQPAPIRGKNKWNRFCYRLAEVCELDFRANKGKIRRYASQLWQKGSGFKESDLDTFERWWYKHDWRGKRGDVPRLDEVVQTIKIAVQYTEIKAEQATQTRYDYISGDLADFIEF